MVEKHISKLPKRRIDAHKRDYGHVFVIAGSQGMTGAGYLASQAAILSGSGLVTLAIAKTLNTIMEIKLTEVMTLALPETRNFSLSLMAEKAIIDFVKNIDVVAMGPGLSQNKETQHLVRNLLRKIEKPIVLDADGINALAGHQEILKNRQYKTILTPHPGEMSRLIGRDTDYIQQNREIVAKRISADYNCVTILKGYRTVVSNPEGEVYINETGNSGMATAGVGDVLTGMVASFVGQGIDPYSAAVSSVYLHGKAGDLAAKEVGQFSLIASDILAKLPHVLKEVV